jgi:hypothetical protein
LSAGNDPRSRPFTMKRNWNGQSYQSYDARFSQGKHNSPTEIGTEIYIRFGNVFINQMFRPTVKRGRIIPL